MLYCSRHTLTLVMPTISWVDAFYRCDMSAMAGLER